MRRTFNYTGRRSIPSELIRAVVHPPGPEGVRSFDMRLGDLASLGLPPSARIHVEPYVKSSVMRFDFGTVGNVCPPEDRSLPDIDDGATVLFRVLVVDESDGVGRILAMVDKLPPSTDDGQRDWVLPLAIEDLGEAVWRLDAPQGAEPRLVITNRIHGLKRRLQDDPILMGAILPVAVRDALRALRDRGDEETEWARRWRRWVADLVGDAGMRDVFDGDDLDRSEEVIEEICDLLVRRREYVSRALRREEEAADG